MVQGSNKRWLILTGTALVLFVVGAFLGVSPWVGTLFGSDAAREAGPGELGTLLEVIALVKTQHVDPITTKDLLAAYARKGTINGMLREALKDPYTTYMDPYAYRQMQVDTTGTFDGIGIVVGPKDDQLVIVAPIDGTPGYKAGLQAGDRIVTIDGRATKDMTMDEAVSLMRGKEGTKVVLGIERDKGKERVSLQVSIVRGVVQVPAVSRTTLLEGKIGFIRLLQFSKRAAPELEEALVKLEKQGMRALVLDMRNNPGGLVTAAVEVANKFIAKGPIVHIVGREGEPKTISAASRQAHPAVPMVILVNKGSASATEIVAAALRDAGLATLVGERTFGKGAVQTVIPLRDGSALSLTTARYKSPLGHSIDKEGIAPDEVVEPSEASNGRDPRGWMAGEVDLKDTQLQKALELLKQKLRQTALQPKRNAA